MIHLSNRIKSEKSGKFGISDSDGKITFYEDLQTAVNAAPVGGTVHCYASFIETNDTEVNIPRSMTIEGHGNSYTLDHLSNSACFRAVGDIDINILNLNVNRINGDASSRCFISSGSNVYLIGSGSIFQIDSGDSAIRNLGNGCHVINCFAKVTVDSGAAIRGKTIKNSTGTAIDGEGINGTDIYNSFGRSLNNYGIIGTNVYNSTGISSTLPGIFGNQGIITNCTGISSAHYGIQTNQGAVCYMSVGKSNASKGIYSDQGMEFCTGISFSLEGGFSNAGIIKHCSFTSHAYHAFVSNGKGGLQMYNCTLESKDTETPRGALHFTGYNGGSGAQNDTFVNNCTFIVHRAESNGILYTPSTIATIPIKLSNNAYKGSTTDLANVTQALLNNADNQGNIKLS